VANALILYYQGDEDRARRINQTWAGGRATLCPMASDRRRIALGARSVVVGLWSRRAEPEDDGRQLADLLARSRGRAILVVWDGRPPLAAVTAAGVPVLVAPAEPHALMQRLLLAAAEMIDGKQPDRQPVRQAPRFSQFDDRARVWGIVVGAVLGALLVIAGLAPFVARLAGP
jgi:hypothetical protein